LTVDNIPTEVKTAYDRIGIRKNSEGKYFVRFEGEEFCELALHEKVTEDITKKWSDYIE
jgi:hypothetical protein